MQFIIILNVVSDKSDQTKEEQKKKLLLLLIKKKINFEFYFLFHVETQKDWKIEGLEHKALNFGSRGAALSALFRRGQKK